MRPLPVLLPALVVLACLAPARDVRERSPSVLLVVADDLGYGDVSCFGGSIPTPAIDRLAREGARLTSFHVAAPVCTPSRYALLTGRHPLRALGGLDTVGMMFDESHREHGLRAGEVTVGEVLRDAGYRTALVGKWHLGHGAVEELPTRHGFERFYGMSGGCVDYFTHRYGYVPDWYRGEQPVEEPGYATDLLTDEAVRFLRDLDDERPFLLVLAYTAPHYGKSCAGEVDPATTLVTNRFGEPRAVPGTGELVQVVNTLQAKPEDLARFAGVEGQKRRHYCAMVAAMDAGVGRVLDALAESGRAGDTLVMFTADHGADLSVSSAGKSGPLRGGKASLWEGGLRVPCVVRWPGRVAPGTDVQQVASTLDLLPTLARLAGADVSRLTLDGLDLAPALLGAAPVERELVWSHGHHRAILAGPWKLHDAALFDLDADPGETRDVAADEPGRARDLAAARDARLARLARR